MTSELTELTVLIEECVPGTILQLTQDLRFLDCCSLEIYMTFYVHLNITVAFIVV
jgi:hypothetical protein